jgi:hypothetical protein
VETAESVVVVVDDTGKMEEDFCLRKGECLDFNFS